VSTERHHVTPGRPAPRWSSASMPRRRRSPFACSRSLRRRSSSERSRWVPWVACRRMGLGGRDDDDPPVVSGHGHRARGSRSCRAVVAHDDLHLIRPGGRRVTIRCARRTGAATAPRSACATPPVAPVEGKPHVPRGHSGLARRRPAVTRGRSAGRGGSARSARSSCLRPARGSQDPFVLLRFRPQATELRATSKQPYAEAEKSGSLA
jgi:hypothetical protein